MSGSSGRDPYEDYTVINRELENFDKKILEKPQIIVANKMDMPLSISNLEKFKEKVKMPVYETSTINAQGLEKVLYKIADMLDTLPKK